MNRYGIEVDRSKPELEQIIRLRLEHTRQYPQIVMKNPDFSHLRDFVLSHSMNQTEMMHEAPDKIKVLNVVKNIPGFEYAASYVNSYVIEYNSFHMAPYDFVKWLTATFPKNFEWSLRQCKNPEVTTYISEKTDWIRLVFDKADAKCCTFCVRSIEEISNKTRVYCVINDLLEFPKCATCGKRIVANVTSLQEGFKAHCDESCASLDPEVQSRIGATCEKRFGSRTYLGSETGIRTKHEKLRDTYGDEQYSRTKGWKNKMEATSLTSYGTRWPSQNEGVRRKMSESMKKSAAQNVKRGMATKKARRGGRFWTDEELKRISDGNKSPENQAKRLERARTRREKYYNERLLNDRYIIPLFGANEFVRVPFKKLSSARLTWECRKCGTVFDAPMCVFRTDGGKGEDSKTYARCPCCYPNRCKSSLEEYHVKSFLESVLPDGLEIVYSKTENFKTIPPYQLDVIVRNETDKKIAFAVEFDGVKWHSIENGCGMDKQLRKTLLCEELGIPLVHVFEDEWLYGRDSVERLLMSYASGDFRSLSFSDGRISVDRSKYNKAVPISGYRLVNETEPELVKRKGMERFGLDVYSVPDCGKLIYERIQP